MGALLTGYLPALYHTKPNDIYNYLAALEPSVDFGQGKCEALPDLANVDRCPSEYLSYLAETINAPLMGENPVLWRNQIKQWPEILRIKGTEKSIKLFLSVIGFARYDIKTYWRDAEGNYVTEKPEGEPFKGDDGVWYSCRTHYFSLSVFWSNGSAVGSDLDMGAFEFVKKWLPRVKPIYAEILSWSAGFAIFDIYETLRDQLTVVWGTSLSESLLMTETGREQLSAAVQPFFNESPWFRHLYSEDGLLYDGSIRYDNQDEAVEYIGIRCYSVLSDTPRSQDGIVSILKIII